MNSALHQLPNSIHAPREAREFARGVLQEWGLEELNDLIGLLVSELVTNSVRYSSGEIGMRLQQQGDHVVVEVVDQESKGPRTQPEDNSAERGRGMVLVQELSSEWGTVPTEHGKSVWLTVPVTRASRRD